MENKYWFKEVEIKEDEEECSMTLAKAEVEEQLVKECEENDGDR